MDTSHTLLLVLATAFSLIIGTTGYCSTQRELKKCLNILEPNSNGVVTYLLWDRTKLEYACSQLAEFYECYDHMKECDDDETLATQRSVYSKIYGYVCGEGRELFLKTRICLNHNPAKRAMEGCIPDAIPVYVSAEDPCDKEKKLESCMVEGARFCGQDGKDYTRGFVKKVIHPVSNCGGKGLSNGVMAAIASGVGITLMLIGLVVKALIRDKVEKKTPFKRMET